MGNKTPSQQVSLPSASVTRTLCPGPDGGGQHGRLCAWAHATGQSIWTVPAGPGREGPARGLAPLRGKADRRLEPSLITKGTCGECEKVGQNSVDLSGKGETELESVGR